MIKKIIFVIFLLFSFLYSSDIEYKGDISYEYKKYDYKHNIHLDDKTQHSTEVNLELKKYFENKEVFLKLEALRDSENKNRDYNKINEFYFKQEFDNFDIKIGKDIKYWGSLEVHNLSDIYNNKNIINNEFDKDKKLGTNGFTFTYFMKNDDSFSVVLSEDESEVNTLDVFVSYSGSRDDIASRDFSYILTNKNDQFITYHTLIQGDNIYKIEYKYSIKNKKYQSGLGLEHTIYSLIDKKDLGIIFEYYNSNNKILLFQDDIFLGSRFNFNDSMDSELLAGIIYDNNDKSQSQSVQYKRRLFGNVKTKISYNKSKSANIFLAKLFYNF